jgi:GTPase SAR1 family protein
VVDTAGQDELSLIPSVYAVNVDGYVIVYSVQSLASFHVAQSIYERLISTTGLQTGRFPVVLVANKVDLKPAPLPPVNAQPPWMVGASRPETPSRLEQQQQQADPCTERVPRSVSTEAGRMLAAQWQATYVETSALDDINVSRVFNLVAGRLKEADDGRFLMSTTGLNGGHGGSGGGTWGRRKPKTVFVVADSKQIGAIPRRVTDRWWKKLSCTSSTATSESPF